MPTIVMVSPKGGVGKTTSALILADQLSQGTTVTVVDADPNRPFRNWASAGNVPDNLTIVADADEENIIERIEDAAMKTAFVIVDLEGSGAKIVLLAVSQADLVIIPMQGSQLDAEQAAKALKVIKQQEKMSRRRVPYGVLLTRTNPTIRTKTTTHIQKELRAGGIDTFSAELNEREAFRAIFSFRKTLAGLVTEDVNNLEKAMNNAAAFASEVVGRLREQKANLQSEVA